MSAVGVVHATMAWAHEEIALGEPTNWAPEVRAVDGEYGEVAGLVSLDPTRCVGRVSIPRCAEWIDVRCKASLALGILLDVVEVGPLLPPTRSPWTDDVANDRYCNEHHRDAIQGSAEPEQEATP